jgi:hypothetical protein
MEKLNRHIVFKKVVSPDHQVGAADVSRAVVLEEFVEDLKPKMRKLLI